MIKTIAIIWLIENIILTIIAYLQIRNSKSLVRFTHRWGFLNGAFVYEDMFIFGLFHTASVLVGFLFQDFRYWLLLFILFWIVRSAGEVLYFFLQQFIEPKHHPLYIPDKFKLFKLIFGNISTHKCFILAQVTLQSVLVVALFALFLLQKFWSHIPAF